MMKPHWTGRLMEGTLTEGTWEAELHPDLHTRDTDIILPKTRGSAFVRTQLETIPREQGVGAVVLAGYSINRCVGLTDACGRGDFRNQFGPRRPDVGLPEKIIRH